MRTETLCCHCGGEGETLVRLVWPTGEQEQVRLRCQACDGTGSRACSQETPYER